MSDVMPEQNEPQDNNNTSKSQTVSTGRSAAPTTTSKSEAPVKQQEEETVPQSYVWLGNGEVLRANDEDLPGWAGHGAEFGYWQKDGFIYPIVGVYPVETKAAE